MYRFMIILALLLVQVAYAAPNDFIDSTTSYYDYSIYYLGLMFGDVGNVLEGQGNKLLGEMFGVLNTIVMSLGIVLVSYTMIMSVATTAQQGEVLGKKYSSIWLPFKSFMSISLLVPTSSGYSLIQVAFMAVITQGVGAANQLWNLILDNTEKGIGLAGTQDWNPTLKRHASEAVLEMFDIALCISAGEKLGLEPQTTVDARKGQVFFGFVDDSATPGGFFNNVQVDPYQLCGYGPDSETANTMRWNDDYVERHLNAIIATVEYLRPYALEVVEAEVPKIEPQLPAGASFSDIIALALAGSFDYSDMPLASGIFMQAKSRFMNGLSENRLTYEGRPFLPGEQIVTEEFEDIINQARQVGWMYAGLYYFRLVHPETDSYPPWVGKVHGQELAIVNSQLLSITNNQISNATGTDKTELETFKTTVLSEPDLNKRRFGFYFSNGYAQSSKSQINTSQADLPDEASEALNILDAMFGWLPDVIYKRFVGEVSTMGEDPLLNLAMLGSEVLINLDGIFFSTLVLILSLGGAASIMPSSSPLPWMLATLVGLLKAIATIFFLFLYTGGFMLAVYMPMIPFLVFTFGGLSWLLFCIEAMVASPIVALGIASPSQDYLGKAAPALVLLINVFLRPVLMIAGFILAVKMLQVVFGMLAFSLAGTIEAQIYNLGTFGPIAIVCVIGFVCITLANKAFSLVYILPDRVIRYIGGQVESFGQQDARSVQEVEQKTQSAGGQVGKALESSVTGGLSAASNRGFRTMGKKRDAIAEAQKKSENSSTAATSSGGSESDSSGGGAMGGADSQAQPEQGQQDNNQADSGDQGGQDSGDK